MHEIYCGATEMVAKLCSPATGSAAHFSSKTTRVLELLWKSPFQGRGSVPPAKHSLHSKEPKGCHELDLVATSALIQGKLFRARWTEDVQMVWSKKNCRHFLLSCQHLLPSPVLVCRSRFSDECRHRNAVGVETSLKIPATAWPVGMHSWRG